MGGRDFAILFDDVPGTLVPEDARAFGSLAAAQAHVANRVHEWLRGRDAAGRMLICPTAYCTRMADAGLGGAGYLRELGERLAPAIDVLWTGPEIVSREITVDHLTGVASLLKRPPVLWDNLFANDYDIGRFFAAQAGASSSAAPSAASSAPSSALVTTCATVSAAGSIRSISMVRMVLDLTAGKSRPSVSAARAQPRSGCFGRS